MVKPEPIKDNCVDWRWKYFQGCLGALDGTFINVLVPNEDKPRFRNRKGQITTNTLAACDRYMRFTYVLPGWEGSAGDARVLRDAVNRPHGLRVPIGNYYLYDNGYANSQGWPEDVGTNDETRDIEYVDGIEATSTWNRFREDLANTMWAESTSHNR
ncbi:hypothetical protein AAHA92_03632 [Salvia divinorum]|uniref:DDE Tnp4 domain-containing protein n=1 Tax=Salvia divinorum TaxID=28513 RepID=A0ABD1IKE8_SALDI